MKRIPPYSHQDKTSLRSKYGIICTMHYQSLTPQDATGLLSLIGLVGLFVVVLVMVRRTQLKRMKQTQVSPAPAAKPFPQTSSYNLETPSFNEVNFPERQLALQQAFEEWKTAYLLRGFDGNTEFLRGESQKRGLRYQVTNTSLTQALAMVIQVQMAQDNDDSRDRFERLLAHLLAHPAQDDPALSSWLSMPDLPTSPRLEPDLHAEAWILCALLAARQQWGSLQRFNLDQILQERSVAFIEALQSETKNQPEIHNPWLLRVIAGQTPDSRLESQIEEDWQELTPLLSEGEGLPGRREALSLLQIGLDGLLSPESEFTQKSDLCFARLKRALTNQESLEGEIEEGFSRLASFSCCVPLALLDQNGEEPEVIWSLLSQAQPAKQDSLGASLRLIAMMLVSGTFWSD